MKRSFLKCFFIITVSYCPLKKQVGVRPYVADVDIREMKDLRKLWEICNCQFAVAIFITTTAPEWKIIEVALETYTFLDLESLYTFSPQIGQG